MGAALLAVSSLISQVNGLYFYIDGTTPKCFFEELAKDTLVVGMLLANTSQSAS
jgi:p24 family protein alpha